MTGRKKGDGGGSEGPAIRYPPLPSPSVQGAGDVIGGRGVTSQSKAAVLIRSSEVMTASMRSQLGRELEKKPAGNEAEETVKKAENKLPAASNKAYRVPARPGYGKEGKICVVRANHFLVNVADRDLHHYDVTIKPQVTNKRVCREIMKTLDNSFRNKQLAYDGRKSAYTAGELPFTSKEFVVKLESKYDDEARRERKFSVLIKFASKADLHHLQQFLAGRQPDVPQETVQALDVVLRASPSWKYAVVGRLFFDSTFGVGELGEGLDFWKGYYQCLRPTQLGLSLNIDISARPFYEPVTVSEFVRKYFNREPNRILSDQDRVKVKKVLRGMRVVFNHREYVRSYKVASISTQPISKLMFQSGTGEQISAVQYFRKKYNISLKYTSLPALNAGTNAKPIYLPMEICKIIKGQRCSRKLNEAQVSAMLKATCQRPADRENSIKKIVSHNEYDKDDLVNEFGIKVKAEFASVDARVLNPPKLKYHASGRESLVEPRVGQWNMINKKMINGGRVDFWACVNFSRLKHDVAGAFCRELVSMCCSKGIVFNPQSLLPIRSVNPAGIEKALLDIHSESEERLNSSGKHLQLLIERSDVYVKLSWGLCPNAVSLRKKQYLENVSLKINVKVGGRNTVLASALDRRIPLVSDRPTIIIGADVTHPQAGEDSSPSIPAVVASMDWPEVTKYRGLISAQGHRDEMIKDLYNQYEDPKRGLVHGGMIRELLIAFRRSTNFKPHRIIFYRDGVSEGQFKQVLLFEIDAIRKACQSLEENYLPPITFVVVQKRHHTRLFPTTHGDPRTTDRSGNILPGTVVDTNICHPTELDFYLCSYSGIQGTSRPTHYHVLYDENNFSADSLQTLTNQLCYTYVRCSRSVSIVAPAYYAHLAAFRARYYGGEDASETGSTSGARNTREGYAAAAVQPLPAIKENVKEVMFYC